VTERERIRIPPSGAFLTGGNPGDVLTLNADGTCSWQPGGGGSGLPFVDSADNGDLLQVVAGVWAKSSPGFAITGFAYGGPGVGGVVLLGASVSGPPFTASYSQPPDVATLTDNAGNPALDVSSTPESFSAPHTYTKTVFGQSVTWTLNASRGANAASPASVGLSWGQLNYNGSAVDPGGGGYTQAFIKSLGSTYAVLSPNGTYAANAAAGASVFFATRTAYGVGALDFTVLGLPFAISKVAAAVALTNGNGVTENYDLWRSDSTGLGAFSYVVS
jgi:hypothetical protein